MPHWSYAVVAAALSDDPREAPLLAQQAGFAGIQYDAFGPRLRVTDLSASGRREVTHMLETHHLHLAGLRVTLPAHGLSPGSDIDHTLHLLDGVLQAATSMSAARVCLDLGPLPPAPGATLTATPAPDATNLNQIPPGIDPLFITTVDAALADLGARADRYGVMLALRSDLSSLAALERALRVADCVWFGIDLDPVGILRDRWTIDQAFARLGSLVRHVRGRDAHVGLERQTRPSVVGAGDVPWPALMANLDSAGFRGWITVDPLELLDRRSAAATALKYLLKH